MPPNASACAPTRSSGRPLPKKIGATAGTRRGGFQFGARAAPPCPCEDKNSTERRGPPPSPAVFTNRRAQGSPLATGLGSPPLTEHIRAARSVDQLEPIKVPGEAPSARSTSCATAKTHLTVRESHKNKNILKRREARAEVQLMKGKAPNIVAYRIRFWRGIESPYVS